MIKNWKLFTSSINELVKNQKLVRSYIEDIEQDILQELKSDTVRVQKFEPSGAIQSLGMNITNLVESDLPKVEDILLKWKDKLAEQSIMLSFNRDKGAPRMYDIQYNVHIKDILVKRIKPKRFILHASFSDPKSILEKGLIPSDSSKSKHWDSAALAYPPAVFAVNTFNPYKSWMGRQYLIDTNGLNNKWWCDLNFPVGEPGIMTFEAIPPSNIVMLDKNDASKIWKLQNSGISKELLDIEIEKIFQSRKGFIYVPNM